VGRRLASLMAIFMQVISARLGVVTGKDLAQCCRDWYPEWTRWPNWLICEVAIGACDLAEVLGSAVALNLLFHIPCCGRSSSPAWTCCCCWAATVRHADHRSRCPAAGGDHRRLLLHRDFRSAADAAEFPGDGAGAALHAAFSPGGMLYVAIGIIGATVMPHNLYLHSALVQSRKLQKDERSIRRAIQFNTIDSTVALTDCVLRQRGHPGAGGDGVLRQDRA
jgi:manganese transport protein